MLQNQDYHNEKVSHYIRAIKLRISLSCNSYSQRPNIFHENKFQSIIRNHHCTSVLDEGIHFSWIAEKYLKRNHPVHRCLFYNLQTHRIPFPKAQTHHRNSPHISYSRFHHRCCNLDLGRTHHIFSIYLALKMLSQ